MGSCRRRRLRALLALLALALAGCGARRAAPSDTTPRDTTAPGAARAGAPAALLSAFFGLDDAMPLPASLRICPGAGGADGMPVIFSREVDPATLQAGDFRVTTAGGAAGQVRCVTLAPALDAGELRTALLVGELGGADDPPARVEVVGSVLSSDGALDFRGASAAVTPLADGPTLVFAEAPQEAQWKLGDSASSWSRGGGCPAGTLGAVRAVWAGGVTPARGEDDGATRARYQVTLLRADGTRAVVTPFALGDLGDGDNNQLLCLDVAGAPLRVSFPAGHLADPNGDLNPDTAVDVAGGR